MDGLNHITFKFHNKVEVARAFNCTNLKVLLSIDPTRCSADMRVLEFCLYHNKILAMVGQD